MNNPLHNIVVKIEKKLYPITVKYVVDDLSDTNRDIQDLRDYSHRLNITFITREYNSFKYSDDRYNIERLPAFHIYVNSILKKTFYPNTDPYKVIDETLNKYLEKLEKKKQKKNRITDLLNKIMASIRKIINSRKTHPEEKMKNISVSEWP